MVGIVSDEVIVRLKISHFVKKHKTLFIQGIPDGLDKSVHQDIQELPDQKAIRDLLGQQVSQALMHLMEVKAPPALLASLVPQDRRVRQDLQDPLVTPDQKDPLGQEEPPEQPVD